MDEQTKKKIRELVRTIKTHAASSKDQQTCSYIYVKAQEIERLLA